jgi:hypothetical protein
LCFQCVPLLRGEWNANRVGLLASGEARVGQAVDAMLGALPLWAMVRRHRAQSLQRACPKADNSLACCAAPTRIAGCYYRLPHAAQQ